MFAPPPRRGRRRDRAASRAGGCCRARARRGRRRRRRGSTRARRARGPPMQGERYSQRERRWSDTVRWSLVEPPEDEPRRPEPRDGPLAVRMRPRRSTSSSARSTCSARARRCAPRSRRARRTRWCSTARPGSGKTTLARLVAAHAQRGVRGALRGQRRARGGARGDRARRRAAARRPASDDLLPRRDPPLQQGPAGRAAAGGRGGPGHADRGDDGEPVLRGQLRAALARAGLRAAARWTPTTSRPCCGARWSAGECGEGIDVRRRGPRVPRRARGRRRPDRAVRAGAGVRRPRSGRRSRG